MALLSSRELRSDAEAKFQCDARQDFEITRRSLTALRGIVEQRRYAL